MYQSVRYGRVLGFLLMFHLMCLSRDAASAEFPLPAASQAALQMGTPERALAVQDSGMNSPARGPNATASPLNPTARSFSPEWQTYEARMVSTLPKPLHQPCMLDVLQISCQCSLEIECWAGAFLCNCSNWLSYYVFEKPRCCHRYIMNIEPFSVLPAQTCLSHNPSPLVLALFGFALFVKARPLGGSIYTSLEFWTAFARRVKRFLVNS